MTPHGHNWRSRQDFDSWSVGELYMVLSFLVASSSIVVFIFIYLF